jgi:outer membrane protein assembly factor BamD (BamD/ComL family)
MYNQAALTRSRSAFVRQWGNRPLEDNWRRKDKEAGQISFKIERGVVGEENQPTEEDKEEAALAQRKADFEAKKKEILSKVPNSQQQLAQSKRRQEEAYYQLGKIYKLQFNEPDNAKKMFVTLLDKFPETVYEQEVLYILSLMSDNIASNEYRTKLLQKHPFSSYARQLKRGNIEINADTESNAERAYQDLYALYQNGAYNDALDKANSVLLDYTGTSIEDKIAMLRILLLAKTSDLNAYRIALLDFTTSYPSSNLAPKASEMLAVLNKK